MKGQQAIVYQLDLFSEQNQHAIPYSEGREGVPQAQTRKGTQVSREGQQGRALAGSLMAVICSQQNISQAYKRVKQNKGVAGIDQMPTGEFAPWFSKHGAELIDQLLKGVYVPDPVKQVEIPKQSGGKRKLGIPTVTDRIIQQAIAQVLSPIYEPIFSNHSYGFRPKRSAHQALLRASGYVKEGKVWVVDMDLQSFFDEVNHDKLMYKLSRTLQDKELLRLIRKYLRSGILIEGLSQQREKGTPQGSPLSPLLSNIVLDTLDKELENRGHSFVRYADDLSIFVRSQKASERVKGSIGCFITEALKLKVNEDKSVVCECDQTKLLGYTIYRDGNLGVARESLQRLKIKIRGITRRNRGRRFEAIISELRPVLRGWLQYFRLSKSNRIMQDLDAWIRRKLRCYRIKQCKKVITLQRFLKKSGVATWQSWILALSGKGHWRKSGCPQVQQAMGLKWFEAQGLYNLALNHKLFNN
jgi:group II intron reverse transcriptase/maturase